VPPPDPSRPSTPEGRPASRWGNDQYPQFDPWSGMSSIMAGVLLWGLIGWGLSKWTGIDWLAGLGILIGGVLGTLVVYLRYGRPQSAPPHSGGAGRIPAERGPRPSAAPPAEEEKP
jgi:ATP synthase protein I